MDNEPDAPQGEPQANAPAQVETTPEATAGQEATTETEQQPDTGEEASEERVKREPWFQKRINEVTREKYEAKREAEQLRAQLAQHQQPQAAPLQAPPTLDDFGWDEAAFSAASAKYWADQTKTTVRAELAAERDEQQKTTRLVTAQTKLAEAEAKHPDFMQAAELIPTNDAVMDLLINVPNATDVLYEVGKNPVEVDRIFSLSPYLQAVELGKIAARLEAPKTSNRSIPPPPPQTVGGLAAGMSKPASEMTMAEYAAARKAGQI
jgi:hypothetical protein